MEEEELDDYNKLKNKVDDALISLDLICKSYNYYSYYDNILDQIRLNVSILCIILHKTNNCDIISYIFRNYNIFLTKYLVNNHIFREDDFNIFNIFSAFTLNTQIKYLNTLQYIDNYLKIFYLPIYSYIKTQIHNIVCKLNPAINYKILALIFKHYSNILSNNMEDEYKILKRIQYVHFFKEVVTVLKKLYMYMNIYLM